MQGWGKNSGTVGRSENGDTAGKGQCGREGERTVALQGRVEHCNIVGENCYSAGERREL